MRLDFLSSIGLIHDSVQGLSAADGDATKKTELLLNIFEANIALREA